MTHKLFIHGVMLLTNNKIGYESNLVFYFIHDYEKKT